MQAIVAERIVKPKPPYGSDWPPRAGPY
jgi:hypothetical protein